VRTTKYAFLFNFFIVIEPPGAGGNDDAKWPVR